MFGLNLYILAANFFGLFCHIYCHLKRLDMATPAAQPIIDKTMIVIASILFEFFPLLSIKIIVVLLCIFCNVCE